MVFRTDEAAWGKDNDKKIAPVTAQGKSMPARPARPET
jgi:hypothetical protein